MADKCINITNITNIINGGVDLEYIQQIGDVHMAIYINNKLYERGKITFEMYEYAKDIFTKRLLEVEKSGADIFHKAV
jgi:hypothetical protein